MKKIMIVDDDKKIVYGLTLRLKSQGYFVVSALDPVVGLSKVIETKPDLLLLDITMPAGGGLLMAERVIKHPDLGEIPIITISASSDPDLKKQAAQLGIKHYFTKPINTHELLSTIRSCVG